MGFVDNFYIAASCQGQFAFVIMSVHAVHPEVFTNILGFDPKSFLFFNMLYGSTFYIFSRPAMQRLIITYRLFFSIGGSCAFNYSSMLLFEWIRENYSHRNILVIFLSFFAGRLLNSMFYSYLYFVDSCAGMLSRRNSILDYMFEDE